MWEYLVGVINEPVRTLREVAEKRLWRESLLLVVVITLIGGAVSVVSLKMNPAATSNLSSDPTLAHFFSTFYSPAFFLPFILLSSILSWFIAGAIYYGFSRLFKGQGSLPGMLASLGFAETPSLVSAPLTALALLLGPAWIFVSYVPGFVAWVWILVLDVLAIRESQHLDTGQAIAVLLITVAAVFVLIMIIVIIIAIIAAIAAVATGSVTS
jgi:hypothetical protein